MVKELHIYVPILCLNQKKNGWNSVLVGLGLSLDVLIYNKVYSSFASYESNVRMRPERQTELAKLE